MSSERISKDDDRKMDDAAPSNGHVEPGISIRMGPVENMEVDAPVTNGNGDTNGKRKARNSIAEGKSYKDASSSDDDDDKPLVRSIAGPFAHELR